MQVSQFLKYITPDVPVCPTFTVQTALMRTAQELCRSTLLWDAWQDPIDLQDGVNDIDLVAPSGAAVCNVKAVNCGPGLELDPKDPEELRRILPDWQTALASVPQFYNCARDWGTMQIYPIPCNPTVQLNIQACYEPTLTATALPDWFTNEFHDALVSGTKARLMGMRAQKWTDLLSAKMHADEYERLCADARIQADHGRVQGIVTMAPRRFGRP